MKMVHKKYELSESLQRMGDILDSKGEEYRKYHFIPQEGISDEHRGYFVDCAVIASRLYFHTNEISPLGVAKVYDMYINEAKCILAEHELCNKIILHGNTIIGIYNFGPEGFLNELLDEVLDILSVIPIEIKENLNSYCRIVYEMIENKDIDSLLDFAPLEYKLKIDPDMKLNLNQEYLSLIDFVEDSLNEKLFAKIIDIDTDEKNIFIDFEAKVHYLSSKHPHKINAILIDENDDEFPLEISGNQIILPFDLIEDKQSLKIKMRYYYGSNCKESYLINTKRQSIIFNNFDFEMGN